MDTKGKATWTGFYQYENYKTHNIEICLILCHNISYPNIYKQGATVYLCTILDKV